MGKGFTIIQWLLISLAGALIVALGFFVVYNAFAGTGQQAGQDLARQVTDTLFGWAS
jgi:hypothetical protein